jgi:hypothetical protein
MGGFFKFVLLGLGYATTRHDEKTKILSLLSFAIAVILTPSMSQRQMFGKRALIEIGCT